MLKQFNALSRRIKDIALITYLCTYAILYSFIELVIGKYEVNF